MDIETALDAKEELEVFADWCKREFCGTEPEAVHQPVPAMPGTFLGGLRLGRKAFFVASGGLSHTLDFFLTTRVCGPDGRARGSAGRDEKGPHGRLLDMSDDEFATWNPEGREGHLYMLRGAWVETFAANR